MSERSRRGNPIEGEGAQSARLKATVRVLARMAHDKNPSDVLGSYTGNPTDGGEPVQDQDDL